MGGTKWNKGGTSKGTYGPVGWDLFAIQILPSVGSRGAENGLKMAKNVLVLSCALSLSLSLSLSFCWSCHVFSSL